MPRLRVKIDYGIDFSVSAAVEAFGHEAMVGLRWRKVVGQQTPKLTKEEVVALEPQEFSEIDSE